MLAEIAVFSLCIALMLSLVSAAALWRPALGDFVPTASSVAAALIFFALTALIILRLDSDFTVVSVADHSNRALPLLYKIAGAWGNHEGSMLLWALVMATMGAALSTNNTSSPACGGGNEAWILRSFRKILSRVVGVISCRESKYVAPSPPLIPPQAGGNRIAAAVQALLTAGVLLFILVTSNPFARIFPPPVDGKMLNPLLQDMALSIHPPLLYLGYVGFSAVFSLAIAGLLARRIDSDWAKTAHPWMMFSWSMLTVGIALGSWWAYRELGWGGFWFWDPVENASLLPWLAGTALIHSNIVLKKRGMLAGWVALLAILTFALSLIGTFLVRSGAITSVHSFASDPTRGLYILGYIALTIGGGLTLYSLRIASITSPSHLRPASREGVIVINNLFLLTACATVLLGTLYPLLAEIAGGHSITVGAPYFNRTFLPMMALCLLFAGIAPFLPWKKAALTRAIFRAWPAWSAALVTVILVLAFIQKEALIVAGALSLAAFLMVASSQWLAAGRWRNAAHWPVFLAHFGASILVIGITCVSLWSQTREGFFSVGNSVAFAGHMVDYQKEETLKTPNYKSTRATLRIRKNDHNIATLTPEFRRYTIGKSTTSETAIYSTPAYDIYAVIGETNESGATALRLYYKPTISFVWLGALLIASGGLLSSFIATRRRV